MVQRSKSMAGEVNHSYHGITEIFFFLIVDICKPTCLKVCIAVTVCFEVKATKHCQNDNHANQNIKMHSMRTCNKRFENAATRVTLISFFIALNIRAINISSCKR